MFLLATLLCTPSLPYADLKAAIERDRIHLAAAYASAGPSCREEVLDQARSYLFNAVADDLFAAWYGTPWDFNGTTSVPRQGHIACGYFVTTILQHAGFKLPRYKWAQLAAEPMIRRMALEPSKTYDASVNEIEAWLRDQGDGLYVVGLDNHVGFIFRRDGSSLFVHSGYYRPEVGVVAEPLDGPTPFAVSRCRVIGKLFDDAMVVKWLTGEPLGQGR
ncbi:MAG: hypothetical protein IPJ76_01105 [Flavobacteriales bacterium]|nr:MAG: hypothetical protein IPJ76_01105 [Flavobacteriales bacterium]